jgi:hypothetical protein
LRGHSGEGNAGEGGESKEEGRTPRRNVRALWREGREQLTQGEEEPVCHACSDLDRGKREKRCSHAGKDDAYDMRVIDVSEKEMRRPGHVTGIPVWELPKCKI